MKDNKTETPEYPIRYSEDYRHYNSLIWQVPSWGIAISAGVIVAANQIGNCKNNWIISISCVRALILLFGAFLLFALSIALYKYRLAQAASVPYPIPSPPFKTFPPANLFLQLAICLTSGGLFGMALTQGLSKKIYIYIGFLVGFILWILFELGNKKNKKIINTKLKESSEKKLLERKNN